MRAHFPVEVFWGEGGVPRLISVIPAANPKSCH